MKTLYRTYNSHQANRQRHILETRPGGKWDW